MNERNERERKWDNCPGCGRHCPADDLQCGRGRALLFGERPDDRERFHEGREHMEGRRFHEDPRRDRPFEGEPFRRGPERRWGPPPFEEGREGRHGGGRPPHPGFGPGFPDRPPMEDDGSLTALFRRCAHEVLPGPRADSQQRVLRILSWREEMSQRELQDHLRIRPGSLSELLAKLEARGLLQRERSEEDRRRVTLRLTEAGREAAEAAPAPGDPDARFAALSDEERETLRGLLQKLLDAEK